MPDFHETHVKDVMQSTVSTIEPTCPLVDAAWKMYADRVSCLVVDLQDPTRGFGIVTQKDLVGFMTEPAGLEGLTVADAMTTPIVTVPPSFSITTAIEFMRMYGVRRLPVVDGQDVVGLLTMTDVFRFEVGKA